jgi:hypothetical protein
MTDKPKRRFWQIHLSTAVFLSLTFATLMYLNLAPTTVSYMRFALHSVRDSIPSVQTTREEWFGWPMPFAYRISFTTTDPEMQKFWSTQREYGVVSSMYFDFNKAVLVDSITALLVLYVVVRLATHLWSKP